MPARPSMPSGLWLLPLLCVLAACGGGSRLARTDAYSPGSQVYPEPGPPGDPWRPYIRDASNRFSVPQQWIRAVMHQESGGHEYRNGQPIVSSAGAMGLMQLMPATYADLQAQYNLGNDPFEPHDNILAGTAYIRQMYSKYGAPAFLAAYNAGPQRLEDYLYRGRSLPNETVNYVASIAPNLGTEIAMSGPLAAYATGGTPDNTIAPVQLASYRTPVSRSWSRRRRGGGAACWHDPDAAYDPDAPCQTPPVPAALPVAAPVAIASAVPVAPPIGRPMAMPQARCPGDPDAAYDEPCPAAPIAVAAAPATIPAYQPATAYGRPSPIPVAARAPASFGNWAIQVGAYTSVEQARFATTMARQADYALLAGSQSVVQPTQPFGHGVLYRARLAGLARADAGQACSSLSGHGIPCMVVQPGG
ncbi:lytic transglycosylase domain-containing protein [Acetobacteraceae bacterium KSS8]|uniref:Lytic transglycosylase domain-containing protein n=1 Tax=Endosaccharibacter trunci TaxID=2812733 RepID=A0ABT1W8P1_9PROT|nr:lytic transglycosylase domain-containing protein [Acetobacteraceae bacterium KSS8]